MTEFLKLTKAGDSVTMRVSQCALTTFGTYPGLVFSGWAAGTGDKELHVEMPRKSAERQLTRENLTTETVVGKVVEICREPNAQNHGKPWWALYVRGSTFDAPSKRLQPGQENAPVLEFAPLEPPNPPAVKQDGPAKPAKPTEAPSGTESKIEAAYRELYGRVKQWAAPNDVQPATATIWIDSSRRGAL